MKTLKQFLKENNIQATSNQRAKIGILLFEKDVKKKKVKEGRYMAVSYEDSYLNNPLTQKIIIDTLLST